MHFNIDAALNNARSVLRGEAAGSVRFMTVALLALSAWAGVSVVQSMTVPASSSRSIQEGRFRTLSMLAEEYRALTKGGNNANRGNVDVPTVFAQVSERLELGVRVNRISPDGRNQAVEINRLYAEELTELERQLAARGVRFLSAEIRALPSGGERLFTISAVIGPESRRHSRFPSEGGDGR